MEIANLILAVISTMATVVLAIAAVSAKNEVNIIPEVTHMEKTQTKNSRTILIFLI